MNSLIRKIKKVIKAINIQNIKSILKYIKQNGFKGLYRTCVTYIKYGKAVVDEYATWIDNNEPKNEELENQRKYESCQNIKFDIILEDKQERLIQSIKNQTYSNWSILEENTENILKKAKGDYLIWIGKDIELAPFALYELVIAIEKNEGQVFYSDNDFKIDEKRQNPVFKPDFAIDTLLSKNYIGNMIVVKTKFLEQNPEIISNINLDIYYDLILRISEKTNEIVHISKVLYHDLAEKRQIDKENQKEIIKQYLQRNNLNYTEVKDGIYEGTYKIEYKIIDNPKVSLVIPNKDHIEDLKKLIESVNKSTYKNYEIVIVENNSKEEKTFKYYEEIVKQDEKIKVEKYEIDYFNYSAIVNFGVKKATGKYVILLNNDIEILTNDWIEQMLMYVQRKDVGICGVKLYFPDRSIQHAGVTIGVRGLAGHRYREVEEKDFKQTDYINIVQNLSSVTAACFMVEKDLYEKLLGFDEKLAVAFNDVDFCLKVRKAGLLIVYNPYVCGYHYESKSRGEDTESKEKQRRFAKEYELFVKRWSEVIAKGDPYYNKNYLLNTDIPKINYNKIV